MLASATRYRRGRTGVGPLNAPTIVSRMRSLRRAAALSAVLAAAIILQPGGAAAQERAETVRIPFPRDDGSLTPYTFRLGYTLMFFFY